MPPADAAPALVGAVARRSSSWSPDVVARVNDEVEAAVGEADTTGPMLSVNALVDFTKTNGATRLVPGRHRWPDRDLPMAEQTTPAMTRSSTRRCQRDRPRSTRTA
jgi:ectoine hydroxylase-related dioxygenase (phytanoyl-CoA dioxygenase family)